VNPVLRLAAEHLERAADPSAGRDLNELRASQLIQALAQNDDLIASLVPQEDDALVLSPIAWAWLLPLLAQASLRPPDAVLDGIFERTQSQFVRLRVVQAVTATSTADADPWLLSRIRRVLRQDPGSPAEAVTFGLLLLQSGDEPARRAFRMLYAEAPPDLRSALGGAISEGAPDYAAWFGRTDRPDSRR
jgi:hypothetical protein